MCEFIDLNHHIFKRTFGVNFVTAQISGQHMFIFDHLDAGESR